MTLLDFLPAWVEILVSVLGFAGFICIATWNKSPDENSNGRR